MPIQVQKTTGAGGGLDPFHYFGAPPFFFHLFLDEPVHQDLDRVILGSMGGFINGIDPLGIGLLHRLRMLRGLEHRFENVLRRRDRRDFRQNTAIDHVSAKLFGVGVFLCRLLAEIAGKTLQVLLFAPERQGQIGMGGAELLVELAVKFREHFCRDFWSGHALLIHHQQPSGNLGPSR